MIGRIRLQWWRESLEKLEENKVGVIILQSLQIPLALKKTTLNDLISLIDLARLSLKIQVVAT